MMAPPRLRAPNTTIVCGISAWSFRFCGLRGFASYLGSRLLEQATLLQEVTVRLADLDEVPVGIAQVATQFDAPDNWRAQELGSFGGPVAVDLVDIGDTEI